MASAKRILTGDRPTGRLHIGHYVGSLLSRVAMQETHEQFILIADIQALTDNASNPQKVSSNIIEVALDNLAAGVDPTKSTLVVQSMIPEIAELTVLFLNLVTVARLERNPTVKDEMKQKGYGTNVPAGFLTYPVSQAADILVFRANTVPTGDDQKPMIEQTNELAEKFNATYKEIFPHVTYVASTTPRLPGIDGNAKMSKSLGNSIHLADEAPVVAEKVMQMYTDPAHIHVEDPGNVEGNTVFAYLDAFDPNKEEVAEIKARYRKGGLGDIEIKKRLIAVLEEAIGPIRERRSTLNRGDVLSIIKEGTARGRREAAQTMTAVREAMGINYF
ncbi:MAG: tryptophan--tRNA ligase [bacterium]|nr:tryptophan--tRNA ligase [bacterium]